MIRGKFRFMGSIRTYAGGTQRTCKFVAEYDQSIEEDRRFQQVTPSGTFEVVIDNPRVLEMLKDAEGKAFYLDLTPAE